MVEFDQMWFIFQHSLPCGPTHFFHWCCLDSCGIKALILFLEKVLNCRYDLIIGPILLPSQVLLFSCCGTENSQSSAKSGEYGWWSTSSKPQSCTAAIATTDLCAGTLSWWNRTPFVSFQGHLRNVSSTTYKSPDQNYLSSVGLSGRTQCS